MIMFYFLMIMFFNIAFITFYFTFSFSSLEQTLNEDKLSGWVSNTVNVNFK